MYLDRPAASAHHHQTGVTPGRRSIDADRDFPEQTLQPIGFTRSQFIAAQSLNRHDRATTPRHRTVQLAQRIAVSFEQDGVVCAAIDFILIDKANRLLLRRVQARSEEHTSELQSLMRISYAVFCLKKKKNNKKNTILSHRHY